MKKTLLLCMMLSISLWSHAQATDLVVDCQTPGWLSSKINYGDQQTVKNLKVTGYINNADLEFIGSLISSRSLNGELDLSECNIVGVTADKDNKLGGLGLNSKDSIKIYRIPRSVTEASSCTYNLYVDTLYFDCQINYIEQVMLWYEKTDIGHLYIGENVDSIPANAFVRDPGRESAGACTSIKSVHFPSSIKYIGEDAFSGSGLKECNFNDLVNLEYLGGTKFINGEWHTFGICSPDTIIIPHKLTSYPLKAFIFKEGAHIFIEENTKTLIGGMSDKYSYRVSGKGLTFHINQVKPPYITYWFMYSKWFEGATVYVPQGAKNAYENSGWSATTIIEMNPVVSVTLNEHSITLNKTEQFNLSVSILPEDADDKTINWTSEDTSVATVDENGVVTAIKEGQTEIVVTSTATGLQDRCTVLVRKNVTNIALEESQITISNIGESKQLTAIITPEDATEQSVTWKSSNEAICTVTNQGLVTATGIGSTLVTATTVDGGLTATCIVKVIQHVSSISLDKTTLTLKVGETGRLQATVSPDNADNKKVNWSSSNEQLATVDAEGNVQALKAGDVWITVTSDDNSEIKASCKVTIIQPVTEISLSQTNIELTNIGESIQLEATIMPEDASDKSVTWKSNNEQVCIVSSTGMVTAIGAGTTVVTATTNDGGKMAFCIVNVSLQEYNITLDQYTMTLNVGETAQLHATVTGNTTKTVNWSSSNDQIVAVDNNGNVTAIKVGNALIYATLADLPDVQTSCAVTVNEVDGILEISGNSIDKSSVYDATGRQVQKLKKGLNIVRMKDGTTRKVVLK